MIGAAGNLIFGNPQPRRNAPPGVRPLITEVADSRCLESGGCKFAVLASTLLVQSIIDMVLVMLLD
jgi:hypothetical protein